MNASSGVMGNLWLLLEIAVLSYSCLRDDDIFEPTSFYWLDLVCILCELIERTPLAGYIDPEL